MLYLTLLAIVVLFLVWERLLHERRLRAIPIRIHVNGTRGKTSVTRFIALALREAGIRTVAKTTGERPTIIQPWGTEEVLPRRGPARIREQLSFIKRAADLGAEAIVVECMAIAPRLQQVSEDDIVKSTLGVITNVRSDHLEVMGETLDAIAESLSQSIPAGGDLVIADSRYLELFKQKAEERKTRLHVAEITPDRGIQVPSLPSFQDNVAAARSVCSLLGLKASGGPGTRTGSGVVMVPAGGKKLYFVDAFSANDVDSTSLILRMVLESTSCPRPFVALLNNRADRPLRMQSFVLFLSRQPLFEYILLLGQGRRLAMRYLHRSGRKDNVLRLRNQDPEQLLEEICRAIPQPAFTLFGLGNYRGAGGEFSRFLHGKKVNDAH